MIKTNYLIYYLFSYMVLSLLSMLCVHLIYLRKHNIYIHAFFMYINKIISATYILSHLCSYSVINHQNS